ncbi:MAG: LptF/LptG family permease [Planctomycetota bacterium]|jgi:lipopolysaccharide export system permease protein|nr:LptF/LptG family permease [Planctomycetota bacterium]
MQIFDRYVLRTYLRFCLLTALAFIGMFTFMDLLSRADDIPLAREAVGLKVGEIIDYYLINTLFLLFQFLPYILLIAGIGCVTQLLRNREWTPMLTAGRATWRSFAAIFVCAIVIASALAVVKESLIPAVLPQHEATQRKLNNHREWRPTDLWVRGSDGQRLHAKEFIPGQPPQIRGLEIFSSSQQGNDERIWADQAEYLNGDWQLTGGLKTSSDSITALDTFSGEGFEPDDLLRSYFVRNRPLDLNAEAYQQLLLYDPGHRQAETYMWASRTMPFAALVLLVLGLSKSLNFGRASSKEGIARGLLLCALFFVSEILFRDMGVRGAVTPWLAAFAPVCLFAGVSLWAFSRTPS